MAATTDILSAETIETLHLNFRQRIHDRAARILAGHPNSEKLQGAMQDVLLLYARRHKKNFSANTWRKTLARYGDGVLDLMLSRGDRTARDFSPDLVESFAVAQSRRRDTEAVEKLFDGKDRLYMKLIPEVKAPNALVCAYLKNEGYVVTDYHQGYATDAKGVRRYRIGKLLQARPYLQEIFKHDEARISQNLLIVLSRHPNDIIRASQNRSWVTCLNPLIQSSRAASYLSPEIQQGSLIAYLVSEKDPEMNDPLARILVKPYAQKGFLGTARSVLRKAFGDTAAPRQVLYVPTRAYGLSNHSFIEAIETLIDKKLNHDISGTFELPRAMYADRMPVILKRKNNMTMVG